MGDQCSATFLEISKVAPICHFNSLTRKQADSTVDGREAKEIGTESS